MSRAKEARTAFHTMCSGLSLDATIYYAGRQSQEYPFRSLWIASTGEQDGPAMASRSDQQWAGLGANKRDEVITFPNCLLVWRGEHDFAGVEDEVSGMLAQISDAIQLDPSLGMAPPFPTTAEIPREEMFLLDDPPGVSARIVFDVRVTTRF